MPLGFTVVSIITSYSNPKKGKTWNIKNGRGQLHKYSDRHL